MFGIAHQKATTPSNIQSGFAAGVYPFNPDIFTDDDFLTSFVTDRPLPTLVIQNLVPETLSSFNSESPQIMALIPYNKTRCRT